jgi:CarD family transcriptional regulator
MTKAKTKTAAKKPAAKAKSKTAPVKTSKPVAAAKAKASPAKAQAMPARKTAAPKIVAPKAAAPTVKPAPEPKKAPEAKKAAAAPKPAAEAKKTAAPKPAAAPKAAAAAKPAAEVKKAAGKASAAPAAAAPQPAPVAPKPAAPGTVVSTPAAKKLVFKVNELVVYPAHGVGKISQIEEQEIAGARLELYIVEFEKEKLRLKVPTSRAEQKGMRRLSDKPQIESALKVLKGRARIKRTMWSRRAQEYDAKINSGDIMAVAEVVRDLYRSERQPEQSYSERQLFEQALDRMAREIAAVKRIDDDQAVKELEEYLSKNAKRAPAAGEKAEDDVPAEEAA